MTPQFSLSQLETLHAVLVHGNLTKAARALNLSQPAVSRTIQLLEIRLGYPLFDRQVGKLVPTPEAKLLWRALDRTMPQVNALRELSENLRRGALQDVLIVGAVPSIAQSILPAVLASESMGDGISYIELTALAGEEIHEQLFLRAVDVGFDYAGAHPRHLFAEPLVEIPVIAAVPVSWNVGVGPLTPEDIRSLRCICKPPKDPLRATLEQSGYLSAGANVRFCADTHAAALEFTRQQAGIAFIDPFSAMLMPAPEIRYVPLAVPVTVCLNAVWSENCAIGAGVRQFIEEVKKEACQRLTQLGAFLADSPQGDLRRRA